MSVARPSRMRAARGRDAELGADMLKWTLIFLAFALVAAVFGFGGIAGAAAGIAKMLFFVTLALAAASFIANMGK